MTTLTLIQGNTNFVGGGEFGRGGFRDVVRSLSWSVLGK